MVEGQLPATPSVDGVVVGSAMPSAPVDADLKALADVEVEVPLLRKPRRGEADVHERVLNCFTLNTTPGQSSSKPILFLGLERSLRCIHIHAWCRNGRLERSLRCIRIHAWCRSGRHGCRRQDTLRDKRKRHRCNQRATLLRRAWVKCESYSSLSLYIYIYIYIFIYIYTYIYISLTEVSSEGF